MFNSAHLQSIWMFFKQMNFCISYFPYIANTQRLGSCSSAFFVDFRHHNSYFLESGVAGRARQQRTAEQNGRKFIPPQRILNEPQIMELFETTVLPNCFYCSLFNAVLIFNVYREGWSCQPPIDRYHSNQSGYRNHPFDTTFDHFNWRNRGKYYRCPSCKPAS